MRKLPEILIVRKLASNYWGYWTCIFQGLMLAMQRHKAAQQWRLQLPQRAS